MTFEEKDAALQEELETAVGTPWDDWKKQLAGAYTAHFHKNYHVGPKRSQMRKLWSCKRIRSQADIPEVLELQYVEEDTVSYTREPEAAAAAAETVTCRTLRGALHHALEAHGDLGHRVFGALMAMEDQVCALQPPNRSSTSQLQWAALCTTTTTS